MARTREFDEDTALKQAMELFWHKGYAETSMRDLSAHTGVSHAGLYNVFGDKRELFKKSLNLYDRIYGDMILGALEEPSSGRTEIEAFFYMVLGAVISKQFSDGCMMCNTVAEFGDEPGDVLALAQTNIKRMTKAFDGALRRALKQGSIRTDLDPKVVAAFFTSTFHGIAVMSRAQMPSAHVKFTVETIIRQLD
ncbi:Transcriptional regulator, AcrR family [hydrothermal vent metagenome]|uniref:Transcriptional regulator, AcrR family n=1 Tax=hydrothermal vent metagenome TaxID=652676 RepID=A0A3B0SBK6_9ZZZZ